MTTEKSVSIVDQLANKYVPANATTNTHIPISRELLDVRTVTTANVTVSVNKLELKGWTNGGLSIGLLLNQVKGQVNGQYVNKKAMFTDPSVANEPADSESTEGRFINGVEIAIRSAVTDLGDMEYVGENEEEQKRTKALFAQLKERFELAVQQRADYIEQKDYPGSRSTIAWKAGRGSDRVPIVLNISAKQTLGWDGKMKTTWYLDDARWDLKKA